MKQICIFLTFISLIALPFYAQENQTILRYSANNTYYLVERSNWSKYVNGKYTGLTHRETRARITGTGQSVSGNRFAGNFFILEETLRDMTASSRGIDDIKEAVFTVSPTGEMTFTTDNGYPQLRGFPVYPDTEVQPGDKWQAEGSRIIDPRNDGKKTALTIQVEYEFIGPEVYKGNDVYRIRAKYATRVNKYLKRKTDDPDLKDATGTHDVDILVEKITGAAILIIDRLDETFMYADGSSVRYKGNTALFTEAPVPVRRDKLIPEITAIIAEASNDSGISARASPPAAEDVFSGAKPVPDTAIAPTAKPPVTPPVKPEAAPPASGTAPKAKDVPPFAVEQTPQGIRLSVRDIRFLPDSDTILSDEQWRLDAIAQTLVLVPNGRFLIEGHTASVGKPAGEKELSVRRAQKIAEELTKRGLKADQFMYAGYGGTKPVADNATAEGRAQNRRVEITILE